jgi:hypothetical protein
MRAVFERLLIVASLLVAASAGGEPFTIAMVPDTQNYVDFTHQKSTGFVLDASELLLEQMTHIAGKSAANGGDVVFVAAVGDVWQHVLRGSDPEHERRGVRSIDGGRSFEPMIRPAETLGFEIPMAVQAYRLLGAAGIPFGVPPGNHDYDAWWVAPIAGAVAADADEALLANLPVEKQHMHLGGLDAFKQAFGSDSEFFSGQDWYVGGFDGGSSSAQVFSAGGYRFLHIALEMQAGDHVLAWAKEILDEHPNLPTIVSTHDYLSARGERRPFGTMDLSVADPGYNNDAEGVWRKFIRPNDQIFMVLSGHQAGQALRIDANDTGHAVYQILADFQDRGQAALDAGAPPRPGGLAPGVGDGWYREMTFHLDDDSPRVEVRTYSTHYDAYSSELPQYAQWYKPREQPQMSDGEFLRADEFTLELRDFRTRFGAARAESARRP